MSDWMMIALATPVVALCLGHIWGSRSEAAYWAAHGEDGGAIHYRGRFYRVTLERSSRKSGA